MRAPDIKRVLVAPFDSAVDQPLERARTVPSTVELYDAYAERIHALISRLLGSRAQAEDLTHDVFEVAMKRLPALKLDQASAFRWLYGVAIQIARATRRRQRLRTFLGIERALDAAAADDPSLSAQQAQSRRLVYSALSTLSEKKRTVFILHELDGLTGEEIARVLECPEKTVWSRLAHARREFELAARRLVLERAP